MQFHAEQLNAIIWRSYRYPLLLFWTYGGDPALEDHMKPPLMKGITYAMTLAMALAPCPCRGCICIRNRHRLIRSRFYRYIDRQERCHSFQSLALL